MKVAVYTIALNEEQFVNRWAESCKEADYRIIADTGSTDKTVAKAKKAGVYVHSISIKPWRFEDARNASLALIPDDADYCIALDMDEVLAPGWREELEKMHAEGVTRPRYNYTWNWNPDGTPALTYGGDKIHTRHGYRWKHPVHETLTVDRITEVQGWCSLEIHHHPDNTKPRSQYFPLLRLAVSEDPSNDRNTFYFARELFFHKMYDEAATEFRRHLALPNATWPPERAASMRYLAKCEPDSTEGWLQLAIEEAQDRREAYVELAKYYYELQEWEDCYTVATIALEITEKPLEYLCEEFAWGPLPLDLAAISAYNLGKYEDAVKYGTAAVELDPTDLRLQENLKYYRQKA